MSVKSYCVIAKSSRSAWTWTSRETEGDYHGRLRTIWKEGVKPSDIHSRLSAVCGETAPKPSTVYRLQSFNSAMATTLATTVHEWYCTILKEWFTEAIHKISRGRQRCVDLGGKHFELIVV